MKLNKSSIYRNMNTKLEGPFSQSPCCLDYPENINSTHSETDIDRTVEMHRSQEEELHSASVTDRINFFMHGGTEFSDDTESIDMEQESIVTFNVGGVIFQTLESTLRYPKRPVYRLRDLDTLERHWDEKRSVYFFDRDPAAFQAVLNYMRTGVLHLPHNMCSPQITTELLYWGLPRIDIQPCCWKDYSVGIQSLENLRKLEKDRRPAYSNPNYFSQQEKPTSKLGRLKAIVWNTVSDPSSSRVAKIYGWVVILVILVSIVSFCTSTLPEVRNNKDQRWNKINLRIELVCVGVFTVDLVLHILSMSSLQDYLFTSEAAIDIVSLAPDLINLAVEAYEKEAGVGTNRSSLAFVRSLRALRVFRLFRRVKHLWIILYTLKASLKDFVVMLILFMITVVMFSGAMFYLESNQTFSSIPRGFWWSVITMTTVGYGDVTPQTPQGKILGSLAAFVGVITLGLTIPTLSHNFIYSVVSLLVVIVSIVSFSLRTLQTVAMDMESQVETKNIIDNVAKGDFSRMSAIIFLTDFVCFGFFSVEFIVIFLSSPNKFNFITSAWGIIDFTAIVPDIFNAVITILIITTETGGSFDKLGNTFLILRFLRLFRLFRLIRRLPGLMIIIYTMIASLKDLSSTVLIVLIVCVLFSSFMYFLEGKRSGFTSIPMSCWWGVATLTTVGYGDLVPRTVPGMLLGACCAISGVLVLGVSVPTLVQNFINYFYLFRYVEEKETRFINKSLSDEESSLAEFITPEPLKVPKTQQPLNSQA